jgi:hypothetical protein
MEKSKIDNTMKYIEAMFYSSRINDTILSFTCLAIPLFIFGNTTEKIKYSRKIDRIKENCKLTEKF